MEESIPENDKELELMKENICTVINNCKTMDELESKMILYGTVCRNLKKIVK